MYLNVHAEDGQVVSERVTGLEHGDHVGMESRFGGGAVD